ncbi:SURF1 family protein [uncultured Sphingomonas sp.]|uniref:SURF1 family protein n=1 Tax=uncultured Sphingomonas sp. TaxID=158754 RepID=UPI0035CA1C7E
MEKGTATGRSRAARAVLFAVGLLLIAGLLTLGGWQLARRSWKVALIARVEARLAAPPLPAPGPASWPRIDASAEYARLRTTGRFRHDRETRVRAATVLGSGWWIVTPLVTDRGWTVLVNRGFLPDGRRELVARDADLAVVTGLLRRSEPDAGWPRANDPAAGRWYARDVPAIARARGLSEVAPYFIDADAGADPNAWPRGGLTEVRFRNHHLGYALTWFALAALVAAALVLLARDGRRRGR